MHGVCKLLYLISETEQHAQKSSQMPLTGGQLSSSRVICPVKSSSAVYDEQSVSEERFRIFQHIERMETVWSHFLAGCVCYLDSVIMAEA